MVRPIAFAAPLGLLGLASVWRAMANLYGWTGGIADAICVSAALVSAVLGGLVLVRFALSPRAVVQQDLSDPVQAPFAVIPFMVVMLLGATGLGPHAKSAADVLFAIGLTGALLMGGWIAGGWLRGPVDQTHAHPAYFLPVLAPGLVGALSAGTLGHRELGWACLGLGLIGWLTMGSVIWHRLMFGPPLPTPLAGTRAIEVAPPAVASLAYLTLDGDRVNPILLGLGGFCLLMVLAQPRLLPLYRKVPFFPNYWAFSFPWAAVAALGLNWLALEHPAGQRTYAVIVTVGITGLIGAIAVGSLIVLARRLKSARSRPQSGV